ncbi:MAG: DNA topoisomerase IB [Anaerolineae bacterium]|nr:DNA topoisomerase IB [Anaerolineae bacterium]
MVSDTNQLLRLSEDPPAAARAARLRYVSDEQPGIVRKRWGRGFTYFDPEGKRITGPEQRARFEALVIPPAWTDVWICPHENGHIQVTGRDDKGRKVYIYHPRWEALRNETKFNRMVLFGEALPRLRQRIDHDLRRHGAPRERVLAAAVRLLQETLIRVGNDEYAQNNDSFGLTTLRQEHVEVNGSQLQLRFRGKSGKMQEVSIRDPRAARVLRALQDLPGQEILQYIDDDDNLRDVTSGDVNDYVREATGEPFTAKDFRTWGGTVHAVRVLQEIGEGRDDNEVERNLVQLYKEVAAQLGNTPAVCRDYYVHPCVPDCYRAGTFFAWCAEARPSAEEKEWLSPHEQLALHLLRRSVSAG